MVAARLHTAGTHVREKLRRRMGPRRLGVRPADVDARVVVAASDADTAVRLHVDRSRKVELGVARAVAHLPDPEQLS